MKHKRTVEMIPKEELIEKFASFEKKWIEKNGLTTDTTISFICEFVQNVYHVPIDKLSSINYQRFGKSNWRIHFNISLFVGPGKSYHAKAETKKKAKHDAFSKLYEELKSYTVPETKSDNKPTFFDQMRDLSAIDGYHLFYGNKDHIEKVKVCAKYLKINVHEEDKYTYSLGDKGAIFLLISQEYGIPSKTLKLASTLNFCNCL